MKTKDEIAKIYYQASKDYGKGMRDVINSLRAQGKTDDEIIEIVIMVWEQNWRRII